MDNLDIELLLERLISVNERILEKLEDIGSDIDSIKNELNWIEEHSYAKIVYDGLNEISNKLDCIDM